jgi:cytochrome b involved in lipid metabolism
MGCAEVRPPEKVESVKDTGLNTYEDVQKAIATGKKIVIYEDWVLDVTTFTKEHPGGQHIINPYIGRALSKSI